MLVCRAATRGQHQSELPDPHQSIPGVDSGAQYTYTYLWWSWSVYESLGPTRIDHWQRHVIGAVSVTSWNHRNEVKKLSPQTTSGVPIMSFRHNRPQNLTLEMNLSSNIRWFLINIYFSLMRPTFLQRKHVEFDECSIVLEFYMFWSYDRLKLTELISMEISSIKYMIRGCHRMYRSLAFSCKRLTAPIHVSVEEWFSPPSLVSEVPVAQ